MTGLGFLEENYPISRLTTVGTGGPARFLARPSSADDLQQLVSFIDDQGLEMAVVGLGSNLLAADQGFAGVVVKLVGDLARVERDGDGLLCGGGASLAVVVKRAEGLSLAGAEFFCAIPGTVGGAVRMNAGAYGGETRDVLADALVIGPGGGRRADPDGLEMTYRRSNVGPGEIVAEARLRLRPGDRDEIRRTVREMQDRRRAAQPQKVRTFGSVWKNPSADLTAGRLLEQCGLKGYAIGGARISPVHANFIENTGGATSADVVALMAEARRRARELHGIDLHHEVQMLGPIGLPGERPAAPGGAGAAAAN
ncbi:MAG: UDP-N-acetylmuramate dehydrogenase [Gaiellales bacterium]|jgi:UDP-N-acetylmuramate dehydrogenase